MSDRPRTAADALSKVLEAVANHTHPIRTASVWRYGDERGGYGWGVSEEPATINHGTANTLQQRPTDWRLMAEVLIKDILRLAADDASELSAMYDEIDNARNG